MEASEFRAELSGLGRSQRRFAAEVGANERTVNRWASGSQTIPGWVPVLLRLLRIVEGPAQ